MLRAAGLIALAFVAAQSAVVLAGRSLMPTTGSRTTIPGVPFGYAGPVPESPTSIDPAAAINVSYPNDTLTGAQLSRGVLPFWNRHQGFGAPFLASGHPAVLYPLTPLLTVLPRDTYEFVLLLDWYLAALFTFLYLRTIGVGTTGALLGATAVAGGGFFQYYLAFREAAVTACTFPALLYAVERTVREPAWRWRHVAVAATSYCTITAGQPESTALAMAAVTLYALVSIASRPKRLAALAAFVPGALCAALVTAPHWWTFSDYAFTANNGHEPGGMAARSILGWRTVAAYVTPQIYGRPHTLPPAMIPPGWSWDLSPGWISAAIALGAVFGVWRAVTERSRPLLLLIAASAIVGGRMWGIAPFTLISRLPLFDRIVYPRYGAFLLAGTAAILAGAGWELALSRGTRSWLRASAIWIGTAAALYLLTGIWHQPVFTAIQVRAFSALAWMWALAVPAALVWLRARQGLNPTTMGVVVAAAMVIELVAYMPGYAPETYAVLTVACLGAWLLLTVFAGMAPSRSIGATLAVATLVCAAPAVVLALSDRRGLPVRYDAATAPPYAVTLRALQAATGGRAYAIDGTPQPDFAQPLGLETLNKCDPLQPRGAALFLMRRLDRGADAVCFSGNAWPRAGFGTAMDEYRANRRFFNLGAIRYLVTRVTPVHPDSIDPRMRLAASDAATGVQIWEDLDAFPRAFLACPAARADSMEAALGALPALADLQHEIVVGRDVADPCASTQRAPAGTLESFRADGNDISVRYRADAPGMLVVADAYERGWSARDNGRPANVVEVDGAFLGVPLAAAGEHAVELSYEPPRWRRSLAAAGGGVAILAVVTALPFRRRPRAADLN